jgi:hypothetical protein
MIILWCFYYKPLLNNCARKYIKIDICPKYLRIKSRKSLFIFLSIIKNTPSTKTSLTTQFHSFVFSLTPHHKILSTYSLLSKLTFKN